MHKGSVNLRFRKYIVQSVPLTLIIRDYVEPLTSQRARPFSKTVNNKDLDCMANGVPTLEITEISEITGSET